MKKVKKKLIFVNEICYRIPEKCIAIDYVISMIISIRIIITIIMIIIRHYFNLV